MFPGGLTASGPDGAGFGIYVHWPFCLSKCPYCDFNSHAGPAPDQERWRRALLAELDHFAGETRHLSPTSIFFGGGTPSLMDPDTVAAIIAAVGGHWGSQPLEITLEANPTSVEAARFRAYAQAGVNRLSIGLQALDDAALRFLGRRHSVAEALAALAIAQDCFDGVSFDLIYARPGQTEADWRAELARALDLGVGHLSLYQLTIEEGTAFAGRSLALPDDEQSARLFQMTQEMTEAAGLPAYEVSNHARPGRECRHNLTYWQGGDWLGIGPGAHGRLGRVALAQHRSPGTWLTAVEAEGHGTALRQHLDPGQRFEERVMMGLRLARGIGPDLADRIDARRAAAMVAGGFAVRDGAGLRATPAGRLVLNALVAHLLGDG